MPKKPALPSMGPRVQKLPVALLDVRHAEEIPAQPEIQSEIRPHFPIVFEEPVEFVLVDSCGSFLSCLPVGPDGCTTFYSPGIACPWVPRFRIAAITARDRSGQEQQQVLRQRDVVGQQAGNFIDTGDGDIAGSVQRLLTGMRPRFGAVTGVG